jgi:hypothetical protein
MPIPLSRPQTKEDILVFFKWTVLNIATTLFFLNVILHSRQNVLSDEHCFNIAGGSPQIRKFIAEHCSERENILYKPWNQL